MSRPTVSQTNLERIESYQGEHFDDKLGALLLRAKISENESNNLRGSLDRYMDIYMTKHFQLTDALRIKSAWKAAAIILSIICAGLIIYIGVGL